MRDLPQNERLWHQETDWSRELERGRLQAKMSPELNLPGPGAMAAAATADGVPGMGALSAEKSGGPQDVSSIESARTMAKLASGVGAIQEMGKDVAEQLAKAAKEGLLAAGKVAFSLINKYGPILLIFFAYTLLFEDPFFSTPALITILVLWGVAAYWWPQPKGLRKFNMLELMMTIPLVFGYGFVLLVLISFIAMAVAAISSAVSGLFGY